MGNLDPAGEWLNLSERYRQMTDDELIVLAQQPSELTDAAQQLLAAEISQRKLTVPPVEPEQQPIPKEADTEGDPYAQDRELMEIRSVWSLSDALQVQQLLDTAGIPFFMGSEQATRANAVTSSFAQGVSVKIMAIGLPWAQQALKSYVPANEPQEKWDQNIDLSVYCPKCHSAEVVLNEVVDAQAGSEIAAKFKWSCDTCGNKWEDTGTEGG